MPLFKSSQNHFPAKYRTLSLRHLFFSCVCFVFFCCVYVAVPPPTVTASYSLKGAFTPCVLFGNLQTSVLPNPPPSTTAGRFVLLCRTPMRLLGQDQATAWHRQSRFRPSASPESPGWGIDRTRTRYPWGFQDSQTGVWRERLFLIILNTEKFGYEYGCQPLLSRWQCHRSQCLQKKIGLNSKTIQKLKFMCFCFRESEVPCPLKDDSAANYSCCASPKFRTHCPATPQRHHAQEANRFGDPNYELPSKSPFRTGIRDCREGVQGCWLAGPPSA